jgi:hypothetical protein
MKSFFIIFITTLLLSLLTSRAHAAKAKEANGIWTFYPIAVVQIMYSIFVALGCGLVIFGSQSTHRDQSVIVIGTIFVLFGLTTWPKAIQASHSGVRQRSWNGRLKIIAWEDIRKIKKNSDDSLVIWGEHAKIYVSPYHAGRDILLQKLEQHKNTKTSSM